MVDGVSSSMGAGLPVGDPRAVRQGSLDRWRAGAMRAATSPPPELPSAPRPAAPLPSARPDPVPYLPMPGGGYVEASGAAALRRTHQAIQRETNRTDGEPEFRPPSQLPEFAPAQEVADHLTAALERHEALGMPKPEPVAPDLVAMERQRMAAAQAAADEAHLRALQAEQAKMLESRVERLGDLMQIVAGRYAPAARLADAGSVDRQA
ncbi:MAG: hypothetical protein ABI743_08270 [bacterium]